jgi:predicted RecB family nuclease
MDQNFIDLLEYSRKIALKSSSYSIKHLAPLANFYWSVDNPGGAISLIKYKLATGSKGSDLDKQEAIQWLIDYNRDDVRATFAVREDLRRLPL